MSEQGGPAGLIEALERAAELEHAVLLQYLFAAASLKRRADGEGVGVLELELIRGWERTLLLIAREEMAHLAAVSNLLIAVGAAPWLVRPGLPGGRLPAPGRGDGPPSPAGEALVLERFGERSLARFVSLEREESGEETIAGHYAAISREIGCLEAGGDRLVRATPVDGVNGWGISGAAQFGRVTDAASALAVIEAIVGQGAGGAGTDTHLARLLAVEAELARARFDPARRVAANPVLGAGVGTRVEDRFTAGVAAAFAGAYQAMLLLLELHYALLQAGSRAAVVARRAVQGLMGGVVRPLGEVLAELPVGAAAPGWSCGPTFGWDQGVRLSAERAASWPMLEGMLADAGSALAGLAREGGLPRLAFVSGNLGLAAGLVARGGVEDD